jgi:hypothetical protein
MEGSASVPVISPAIAVLARRLIEDAKRRMLSPSESRCVAVQAMRDASGTELDLHSGSVQQLGVAEKGKLRFGADYSVGSLGRVSRYITVDPRHFSARYDSSELDIASPGLASLLFLMEEVHRPLHLSPEEMIQIVEALPALVSGSKSGCLRFTIDSDEGYDLSQYVEVESRCTGGPKTEPLVSVDILSGEVRDAKTMKVVDSPVGHEIAQRIMVNLEATKSKAQAALDKLCGQVPAAQ